jgi:hypothetical protein
MPIQFPRDAVDDLHRHFTTTGTWRTILNQERLGSELAGPNRRNAEQAYPLPTPEHLREMLDVTFAASIMEEEGRRICFTLAYTTPEGAASQGTSMHFDFFTFREPVPLEPGHIAKLALTTDPSRTTLGVRPSSSGALEIWGMMHHGDHTFAIDLRIQPAY